MSTPYLAPRRPVPTLATLALAAGKRSSIASERFLGTSSAGPRRLNSVDSKSVLRVINCCSSAACWRYAVRLRSSPDRLTVALRGHHLRCKQPGFAQREVEALTSNRVEGMRGIADQQITRSVLFGCGEAHQRPLAALTHRHHAAKSPAKSVLKRSYECLRHPTR